MGWDLYTKPLQMGRDLYTKLLQMGQALHLYKPLQMGRALYYKVTTSQMSSNYNRPNATVKRSIVHGKIAIPVTPDECYTIFSSHSKWGLILRSSRSRRAQWCQVPIKFDGTSPTSGTFPDGGPQVMSSVTAHDRERHSGVPLVVLSCQKKMVGTILF